MAMAFSTRRYAPVRGFSRRMFVRTLAGALPLIAVPRAVRAVSTKSRRLDFEHTHTGERLSVKYFEDGAYVPEALTKVNYFLRDFRTGDIHAIDPSLLDLLHHLADLTRTRKPFQVISAFRSPATNGMLRQRTRGVAAGSLHMKGQAIDIRLEDVPLPTLRSAAIIARRGGVGYYPASDFVHVDTGRVRTW
jgi:uncharacterized protein YcbK (DUF882 family)